jgi:hypothetical protein
MSNDVKWTDWRSSDVVADRHAPSNTASVRMAWLQLLGCIVGLGLLATGLPDPRSLLSFVTDGVADPGRSALPGASAQAAILATAGLVVWVLLIWSVAVCAAAVAGRLPGAPGLVGRSVLCRIAPAAAGRLVAAAVGVSLLAGTSACAAPAIAGLDSGSSAAVAGSLSPGTTSVSVGDGSGVVDPAASAGSTIAAASPAPTPETPAPVPAVPSSDGVIASIVIDWPDAAGSTDSAQSTPSAAAESGGQTPSSPVAAASATGNTDATTADTDSAAPSASTTTDPSAPAPAPAPAPGGDTPPPPAPADAPEPQQPDPTRATAPPIDDDPAGVIVRSGDSLWSIAAHHLPPDSADSDIDSAWRAWYLRNQQVIGDNPDLIQPGQPLLPPTQK